MKLSGTVNEYVRPRWSRWLAELCRSGHMSADVLRTEAGNRDTAPRAALASWLERRRTVSAANAFFVGQRVAADAKLAKYGDPCVALYAAGYLSIAAECLQLMVNRTLENYPNRKKVERSGVAALRHPVVCELTYALLAAVCLPYALAHLDGIPYRVVSVSVFSPIPRKRYLAQVVGRSDPRFFDDAWTRCVSRSGAQPKLSVDSLGLTLADQETLTWSAFLNRLSRRARRDPILRLHFSGLRKQVDEYQRLAFAVSSSPPQLQ